MHSEVKLGLLFQEMIVFYYLILDHSDDLYWCLQARLSLSRNSTGAPWSNECSNTTPMRPTKTPLCAQMNDESSIKMESNSQVFPLNHEKSLLDMIVADL